MNVPLPKVSRASQLGGYGALTEQNAFSRSGTVMGGGDLFGLQDSLWPQGFTCTGLGVGDGEREAASPVSPA